MTNQHPNTISVNRLAPVLGGLLLLVGMTLTSFKSFLLFHSLSEIFSIVIACGIFMIAWHSRRFLENHFFLFIGVAYLFTAGLDLIHTLSYKGMGIFQEEGANRPTQLWIAGRFLESISLLIAPLATGKNLKPGVLLGGYASVFTLILAAIYLWDIFPACFDETNGLTPFKKLSEYGISIILTAAIAMIYTKRKTFNERVMRLVIISILLTIASELAFTFYVHVYGASNVMGHFLKLLSFYFIYRAVIVTGLEYPHDLLFRDLKKRNKQISLAKQEWEQTFDTVPDLIMILDRRHRIRRANRATADKFGCRPGDLVGRPCYSVFHGTDAPPPSCPHAKLMTGKQPQTTCSFELDMGETYQIGLTPLIAPGGRLKGYVHVTREITDQKRTEEMLRQSREELEAQVANRTKELAKANEELKTEIKEHAITLERLREAELRYRTMADFTHDWEYWEAPDGTLLYVSPSCRRITGYEAAAFMENPDLLEDIIVPADREKWHGHRKYMTQGSPIRQLQFRICKPGGEVRWIDHTCKSVTNDTGEFLGFRASNRDITEGRRAEKNARRHREELAQVLRVSTMGELGASLAHELNQPLTAILANAQAALRFLDTDRPDLDEIREILVDITMDDKRAGEVILRLRRLLQHGEMEFKPLYINDVIREVLPLMKGDAIMKNVRIETDLGPGLPAIQGDRIQLQQTLMNFIRNGSDAMEKTEADRRRLIITSRLRDEAHVMVAVRDFGMGLDTVNSTKLFTPFYSTKPDGMGMGLSINRSIIEAHGGRAWARDNETGGATFCFALPVPRGEQAA